LKEKKTPHETIVQALTCKKETDLIADYLTSNLNPRVAAAFEAHVGRCSDCAAFLRTYKKTIEVTRAFFEYANLDNGPRHLGFRPRDAKHSST
jgi:hypothetical protein